MIKNIVKKCLALLGYKLIRMPNRNNKFQQGVTANNEVSPELVELHDDAFFEKYAQRMRTDAKRGGRTGFHKLIEAAPVSTGQDILDIGFGNGDGSRYFMTKGLNVTATTFSSQNDISPEGGLNQAGIKVVNALVENLPFGDERFDAVWCSHVIEHTLNVGLALREIRRVLRPGGWLFIMVPPYKSHLAGGHLMTGWNVGQLIYTLLLCGYNVKDGHFVKLGYNIAGFVRKSDLVLPQLHFDIGDLEVLMNYWPVPLFHGLDGDMEFVNWPPSPQGTDRDNRVSQEK